MKACIALLPIFISMNLLAQTKKINTEDIAQNLKETYSVLKADKQIKQGEYASFNYYDHKAICKGFYKNNLKDSTWVYYGFKNNSAEGSYKNGRRVGHWKIYTYNGVLQMEYDFTNSVMLFLKQNPKDSARVYEIIQGTDTVKTRLDRAPIYLNGEAAITRILIATTRYPAAARERNIQGRVIIGITIDENGVASNYRIKKAVGYGCDEEALRVAKLITGDWLPAMLNGKAVKLEQDIPFNFALGN
ncbi:energy transducer TonB [Mucilaginibacter sp.]|uniref:energy transducer TonB n=1 Tax=Mucilaginibacter sp. TaxID=1882438 RepID=UPI0026021033|nr:energy transducer TonB [Mucilaginibacter sp.]MDB5128373.1 TonB family protein [Mucilaginibacter sp.]